MSEKVKRRNPFRGLARWFRELRSELKKVSWPSRKQLINNTWVVLVMTFAVGAMIWIFDLVANGVVQALIDLFGN